ncbi:MAG: ABC transporter permease [Thermoplasmata archaeon]
MRTALDAIRRRPGRSILTATGIGLSTALVVLLLATSAGIQASATQLATSSGVDLLGASANTTLTALSFPPIPHAHALAQGVPQNDSNVETASPWLIAQMGFGNASLWAAANRSASGSAIPSTWAVTSSGTIGWIPSDNRGLEVPPIYSGPGFPAPGDPHYANGTYAGPWESAIVLDEGLAGVLHVVPGDLVWMGLGTPSGPSEVQAWYRAATAFRVVGISGPFWLIPSALLAFTYLSELQALTGSAHPSQDYASLVLIHLYDSANPDADRAQIERAYPSLSLFTLASILGAVQQAVSLYQTFGTLIAAIGIVVAALFASSVLLMSVDDRSAEIAIRRAIGFPRWVVGGAVVEEGIYLGALGLLIGIPAALAGGYALNAVLRALVPGLPNGFSFLSFQPSVLAAGVVLVLVVGIVASIGPAARTVRLPIARELRGP